MNGCLDAKFIDTVDVEFDAGVHLVASPFVFIAASPLPVMANWIARRQGMLICLAISWHMLSRHERSPPHFPRQTSAAWVKNIAHVQLLL